MSASPTEHKVETRQVDGHDIDIVRLNWPDGAVGYDVYTSEGDCLTLMESLDAIPEDDKIRDLLSEDS